MMFRLVSTTRLTDEKMTDVTIRTAAFGELGLRTFHDLMRLRIDVFVVEQECPYPELDGRDAEFATRHVWDEHGDVIRGYLRLLHDPGVRRIGRVCVAKDHRGQGIAEALVQQALLSCEESPVVLDAQSHLAGWYEGFGFAVDGPGFVEDGIPHVPMRRP